MQVNDSERCKMMQEEHDMKKMWKKVQEKFAGSEKVPTFAIPLRNKGITLRPRVEQGSQKKSGGSRWVWRSSLKRLERKYKEASTKHKKIESVNFLEIRSAGLNLRYKEYTKKSLILAQDER